MQAIQATAGLAPYQSTDFPRRSSWTPRETPRESLILNYPLTSLLHDPERRRSGAIAQPLAARWLTSTVWPVSSDPSLLVSTPDDLGSTAPSLPQTVDDDKIRIKVRGANFETYKSTLDQFPDTLLGSSRARSLFYDPNHDALVFNRDPDSFDAILFFYQSKGQFLSRPESVDEDLFNEEVKFYRLSDDSNEEAESVEPDEENFNGRFAILRRRMWTILEHPSESQCSKFVARLSMLIIILSVIAFCLDTMPQLSPNNSNDAQMSAHTQRNTTTANTKRMNISILPWLAVDIVFVVIFTFEYSARVFAAPNRLRFVRSFLAVVDFIAIAAIAPYYISFIINGKLQIVKSFNVVRALRLLRIVRLLKLYRYSVGLKLLGKALLQSREKMGTLIVCVLMSVVLFSSALYYIEGYGNDASQFRSIPASFWWAITTMSTVGYGDIVPVTPLGKLLAAFCAFTGIILLYILPIPVFVSHFSKIYENWIKRRRRRDKNTQGMQGIKYRLVLW